MQSLIMAANIGALWVFIALLCSFTFNEIVLGRLSASSKVYAANLSHRLADLCSICSIVPLFGDLFLNLSDLTLINTLFSYAPLLCGLYGLLCRYECLGFPPKIFFVPWQFSSSLFSLMLILKALDLFVQFNHSSAGFALAVSLPLRLLLLSVVLGWMPLTEPSDKTPSRTELNCLGLAKCVHYLGVLVLIVLDGLKHSGIASCRSFLPTDAVATYIHLGTILSSFSSANFSLMTAVGATQRIATMTGEISSRKTFVRYISHEVRSPLSTSSLGLDCLLQLLQEESADRQELLDLATDCKSATQSAIQTLSDLLLFDKIESNMLQLDKAAVDFGAFLQQVVRPLERQVQLTGLQWRSEVDEAVRGAVVQMDRYKMEQVMRNFINNALKFTPAGGRISLTAGVFTSASDTSPAEADALGEAGAGAKTGGQCIARTNVQSKVRVEVADTGHGIAPQQLGSLFGQYVQIDAGKLQKGGGSGLGLWLSKAIVEAHGGRVGVHSDGEGKGATFFLELPVYINVSSASSDHAISGVFSIHSTFGHIIFDEDEHEPVRERVVSFEESITENSAVCYSENASPALSPPTDRFATLPLENRGLIKYEEHEPSSKASCAMASKQLETIEQWRALSMDRTMVPAHNLHILIADDSALSRKLVSKLLTSLCDNVNFTFEATYKFDIEHAKTGKEACDRVLESLRDPGQKPFDLVLIDYYMPLLDGAEASQAMRMAGYRGPIMAVTSCTNEPELDRLRQSGIDAILQKPFTIKKFYKHFLQHIVKSNRQKF